MKSVWKPKGLIARKAVIALTVAVVLLGFGLIALPESPAARQERQGEEFVRLALALGRLRPDEVDAYFGPARLDVRNDENGPSLADIDAGARRLLEELSLGLDVPDRRRSERLLTRLRHFIGLLEMIASPRSLGFAAEAQRLYGVELPAIDAAQNKAVLERLDALFPGRGSLAFRMASFQNRLVIPADRRAAVFERALEECRRRTAAHWKLPAEESLNVEFSREVEAAWHRYEGEGRSTLLINPLALAFPGAAIDLACHEGYPGHHAQFIMLEQAAGQGGFAVEDTVVLLRSPESVLREGAAEYGVDLVFPPQEKLAFEREILFPLAELPPAEAIKLADLQHLVSAAAEASLPILRDYYDGVLEFNPATFRLEREALITSPSELLQFVDEYGPYTLGYTAVREKLQAHIEKRAGGNLDERWSLLKAFVLEPDNQPWRQ